MSHSKPSEEQAEARRARREAEKAEKAASRKKPLSRGAKIAIGVAAALLIVLFFCSLPVIKFFSSGYHNFKTYHNFNFDGTCYIYDMETGRFLDDTKMHIRLLATEKDGEMPKGNFIIEGYVDADKLNEENTEEGVFYAGIPVYGNYGERTVWYTLNKYHGTDLDSVDPDTDSEGVPPISLLRWDTTEKIASVQITGFGKTLNSKNTLIAVFGAESKDYAYRYIQSKLEIFQKSIRWFDPL